VISCFQFALTSKIHVMSEIYETEYSADEREKLWIAFYKTAFPMVAKFISNRGGNFEQAKDIFQDAMVIWYEKQAGNDHVDVRSQKGYLFGIVRNLWYRSFEAGLEMLPLSGQPYEDFADDAPYAEISTSKVIELLETTGKKCLDLLKAFYYDKLSMQSLSAGFGFKSVRSATVQKYKCLEKVRDRVKEKLICYEDFFE
jgi:DNA-directed RNA polymerase specialized sigma24 family protein